MDELLEKSKQRSVPNGLYRIYLQEPGFPPRKLLEFYKSGDSIGDPVREPGRGSNPIPANATGTPSSPDARTQGTANGVAVQPDESEPEGQTQAEAEDSAAGAYPPAVLPVEPEEGADDSSRTAIDWEQPRPIRRSAVAAGVLTATAAVGGSRRRWAGDVVRMMGESEKRAFSLAARLRRRFQR